MTLHVTRGAYNLARRIKDGTLCRVHRCDVLPAEFEILVRAADDDGFLKPLYAALPRVREILEGEDHDRAADKLAERPSRK